MLTVINTMTVCRNGVHLTRILASIFYSLTLGGEKPSKRLTGDTATGPINKGTRAGLEVVCPHYSSC